MTGEIIWVIEGRIYPTHGTIDADFDEHRNRYQRAYLDFFEDELVLNGYDWRKVLDEYLFRGHEPLISCVMAGCKLPTVVVSKVLRADSGPFFDSSWLCV